MRRKTGLLLIAGVLAALGLPACSDSAPPAPENFDEMLVWATRELKRRPEPVPYPEDPLLSAPRWPVVNLADRFENAGVGSAWKPSAAPAEALVALGPFQSNEGGRPDLTVRKVERGTRYGTEAIELVLRGFRVQREQVGAIEMELHLPWGGYFMLKWGEVAEIPVPVPRNDDFFTVRVRTGGFPDWEGELNRLVLRTGGTGEGVVRIRSLRLLPRTGAWTGAAGVGRARVERSLRTVVYTRDQTEVRFPGVTIPRRAKFRTGLALEGGDPGKEGIFELLVETAAGRTHVMRRVLPAGEPWIEASPSLDRWAGQEVTLVLKTHAGGKSAVFLWSNPVVYQPVKEPPLAALYLVDTLAAEHIGLYGYERLTMPRLAGLARQGAWIPAMYSNSCRTIESVPDLFFSISTTRHGVFHTSTRAPSELVTLAEALRATGFATASFCNNPYAGPQQNMDQGFDEFLDPVGTADPKADLTVPLSAVRNWLRRHHDRPCFLYVHTAEPHSPYLPSRAFRGRYDTGYEGSINGSRHPRNGFRNAGTPEDIAHVVSLYDEEVAYSDSRIGALLDLVEELGRTANATMLVTSDHGEEFLEHGDWEHATNLHGTQTRVPLVVAGPGIPAGTMVEAPIQLLDLMPTLLEHYQVPEPYALEGRSFLSMLQGGPPSEPRPVFASNHAWMRLVAGLVEYSLIKDGRWKLIFHARKYGGAGGSHFSLHDIGQDPGENRDLVQDEPDRARRMILELVEWRRSQRPFRKADAKEDFEIDFEAMQDLSELGYLGHEELEGGG